LHNIFCDCRYIPDGRVVALGRCEDEFSADTIYIWKTTSIIPSKIIKERVEPATDMAVTSSGELMVLRKEDPIIRVFQPNADTPANARDIRIEVDQNVKEGLMFLETTDTGYIFIVHGDPEGQLLVFNPEGTAVQTVKLGKAGGMAYSKTTKTLYVAADDRILKYHWDNMSLTEFSTGPHGVKRFSCTDVSIGSDGEVFAAGSVDEAATVYQVLEKEGKGGPGTMKEIGFDDKEVRNSYSPWTCVQGDQFVLVYGETKPELGLFSLS
jgi:WD40 repeat protein